MSYQQIINSVKTIIGLCVAVCLVMTGCANQSAKAYPNKSITLIVPYGAGGTADLTARRFAAAMEKQLGQSIVIVNQAGASGSIGTKSVLDAAPDGYTMLFTADSLGTQKVMGISEYSYDDFTPIMAVVDDPKVIVVAKDSKYQSLQDLVEDMKNPQTTVKMSYTGPGGSGHVQALIYNNLGLEMALTAYGSGVECIVAVLGNQVDFTNSNFSTVKNYIESGELRLLGVSTTARMENYPDVPTFLEIFPEAADYYAMPFTPLSLVVDKDVPQEVKDTLVDASQKAVTDADWLNYVKENHLTELYKRYPKHEDRINFYKEWQSKVCWLLWHAGAAKENPANLGIEEWVK